MAVIAATGRLIKTAFILALVVLVGVTALGLSFYYSGKDTLPLIPLSDNDGHTTIRPISHSDPELDAAWKKAQAEAVTMWNDSSEDISITITEDSPNTITFYPLPDPKLALYIPTPSCLFSECNYFILINEEFYTSYNTYHIKYRGRYLIAHELGHALGLNDIYEDDLESIMHHEWRHVSRQPTQIDIQRVEGRIDMFRTMTTTFID